MNIVRIIQAIALSLLFAENAKLYAGLLYAAARNNNVAQAEALIAQGCDINEPDLWGQMPLHYAVKNGYESFVHLLCSKGANINAKNQDGNTPLSLAAFHGYRDVVSLLCKTGADINLADKDGKTPLYKAVNSCHEDVASLLCEYKADVNFINKDGWNPLHCASAKGYESVASLLCNKGVTVNMQNQSGYAPLHEASARGNASVVRILLRKGANVNLQNKSGYTPLHWAVINNHDLLFYVLLAHGANYSITNIQGQSAHDLVIQKGFAQQFDHAINKVQRFRSMKELMFNEGQLGHNPRLLITPQFRGAPNKVSGMYAFLMSRLCCVEMDRVHEIANGYPVVKSYSNEKCVEGLMKNSGSLFASGLSFLNRSIKKGDKEAVARILEAKAEDVNSSSISGDRVLHEASFYGDTDIVRLLIDANADIHAVNKRGLSAHHYALIAGHRGVAKLLEKRGYNEAILKQVCEPCQCLSLEDGAAVEVFPSLKKPRLVDCGDI